MYRILCWYLLFGIVSGVVGVASWFRHQTYRVVFCDVGQGDAILFTYKRLQLLYDSGPDRDAVMGCLDRYMPFGDTKIDVVLISHLDRDHIGGMQRVLSHYAVGRLYLSNSDKDTQTYHELEESITYWGVTPRSLIAGESLQIADGWMVDVMWPSKELFDSCRVGGDNSCRSNDLSIVADVSYMGFDVLVMGDAEGDRLESEVLTNMSKRMNIEVLHVPHHGSRHGMTAGWLRSFSPSIAVISVGLHNRYGHPDSSILQLFKDVNIPLLRTDVNGDVVFESHGDTWEYWGSIK